MKDNFRKSIEERKSKLINILKTYNLYKSDEQLGKFTLMELEGEYKRIQSIYHPHSEMGSIRWINKY